MCDSGFKTENRQKYQQGELGCWGEIQEPGWTSMLLDHDEESDSTSVYKILLVGPGRCCGIKHMLLSTELGDMCSDPQHPHKCLLGIVIVL